MCTPEFYSYQWHCKQGNQLTYAISSSSAYTYVHIYLVQITTIQQASEQKTEVEKVKQQQSEERGKLEKRKKAIDIELSTIEPLVKEAKEAVGNIKTETLSEIRALRMPPDVIRDILEAVLRLMGTFDTSWGNMRRYGVKHK